MYWFMWFSSWLLLLFFTEFHPITLLAPEKVGFRLLCIWMKSWCTWLVFSNCFDYTKCCLLLCPLGWYLKSCFCYFAGNSQRKTQFKNSSELFVRVDGLRPYTKYEFSVMTIKGERVSYYSLTARNTTFEDGKLLLHVCYIVYLNRAKLKASHNAMFYNSLAY